VAFPTETFYGLGAIAAEASAVRRVFEVKGRPASMPLLLLVADTAMAMAVAAEVSGTARALMAAHWPGPLTLVMRAVAGLPAEVTAGTGTVGVRVSSHPVARGLVAAVRAPVTAPSANPTGEAPASTADAVLAYFDGRIAMVLDGGATPGGPASTVVDVTASVPRVLREGAITLPGPGAGSV
jgi:L-threonylcarbamoyladenylate synthase